MESENLDLKKLFTEKNDLLAKQLEKFLDEKRSIGEIDIFNTDLNSEITATEKLKKQLIGLIKNVFFLTEAEIDGGAVFVEADDEYEEEETISPEEVAALAQKQIQK